MHNYTAAGRKFMVQYDGMSEHEADGMSEHEAIDKIKAAHRDANRRNLVFTPVEFRSKFMIGEGVSYVYFHYHHLSGVVMDLDGSFEKWIKGYNEARTPEKEPDLHAVKLVNQEEAEAAWNNWADKYPGVIDAICIWDPRLSTEYTIFVISGVVYKVQDYDGEIFDNIQRWNNRNNRDYQERDDSDLSVDEKLDKILEAVKNTQAQEKPEVKFSIPEGYEIPQGVDDLAAKIARLL